MNSALWNDTNTTRCFEALAPSAFAETQNTSLLDLLAYTFGAFFLLSLIAYLARRAYASGYRFGETIMGVNSAPSKMVLAVKGEQ